MARRLIACLVAALALTAAHAQIVTNGQFDKGGYTYADGWRPLPGGGYRMLRKTDPRDGQSLFLRLRRDGDGGVAQTVDLPAKRTLSLRMLATCWANGTDCALATLTRLSDGMVLAEVRVDGIERGELAANFETGAGGPAELLVRLVGGAGARASVEYVEIGPPIDAACAVAGPDFSGADLVLRPGDGLRVDADFPPRLLPAAAEMLQEALEDATGRPTERVAGAVMVSVPQPETTDWPARESYHLSVCATGITIEAPAEQGAFWAMMTLIDLIRPEPTGGARILAVDVQDQPALPWRMGGYIWPRSGSLTGAVRTLARFKLNMAQVTQAPDRDDQALVDALRTVGIEPVVVVGTDGGTTEDALADAVNRLGARYLILCAPNEGEDFREGPQPLDWASPPLSAVAEFARSHPDVAVIVPATRSGIVTTTLTVPTRLGIVLSATFDNWPAEIIALLPPSQPESLTAVHEQAQSRGVRYAIDNRTGLRGVEAALTSRAESALCLGVRMDESSEDAANLAWRGLPEEVP